MEYKEWSLRSVFLALRLIAPLALVPFWDYAHRMRIIAKRKLIEYWTIHPDTEVALRSWFVTVAQARWTSPQDIKRMFPSASFVGRNRVVFNIKGNRHRLIVAVAYQFGAPYIKFIGTHADYDRIDAATVETD